VYKYKVSNRDLITAQT